MPAALDASAHGFTWLRDLRALGTDAARLRARALVAEWIAAPPSDALAHRPDVAGARITAWLGHYDFFAATADDAFRQRLMARLVSDARSLSAALPAEELDARALTALKGLIAAAVALPEHAGFLTRALRFLPQEIARQVLPDGCHAERSPAAQLAALQDLTEIRALLQAAQTQPPPALTSAIERMAPALRVMRHGDGGLALFNGSREESSSLIDIALTQAGRSGRGPSALTDGGFQRLQAGRSVLIVDCGAPPPPGVDRYAHAGTLSMELSVGRDRMIVNCGAVPGRQPGMARRHPRHRRALHPGDRRCQFVGAEAGRAWPPPGAWWRRSARRPTARTGWRPATTAGRSCSARCIAGVCIWPKAARTCAARMRSRRRRRSPSRCASICIRT